MSGDVNELVEAGDGIEVVYNNDDDDDVNSEDESIMSVILYVLTKLGDSTYSCIPLLQQNVKFFLLLYFHVFFVVFSFVSK